MANLANLDEALDKAEAGEATVENILPEDEEMEEVEVIPEGIMILFINTWRVLESSPSVKGPGLNTIQTLPFPKRYSASSMAKREPCSEKTEPMELLHQAVETVVVVAGAIVAAVDTKSERFESNHSKTN